MTPIGAPGRAPQADSRSRADAEREARIAALADQIRQLQSQWIAAPHGSLGTLSWFIAARLLDRLDREAAAAVAGATERVLGVPQ